MLNQKFFQKLHQDHEQYVVRIKKIVSQSNQIISLSKRAIFSLHRGDIKAAEDLLKQAEEGLSYIKKDILDKKYQENLDGEGSWRAAQEEFVEAKFFHNILTEEKIDFHPKLEISREAYVGGLCDLVGEIVRHAINLAANQKFEEVKKMNQVAQDVIAELIKFDFTGYLRTKYDQSKNHLRKMENILYDIEMRRK